MRLPAHSPDVPTEAFRRGVLSLFVAREPFAPGVATEKLDWFHSGFSVHDGVWLDEDDAVGHERLARCCAGCPVSLDRLEYDGERGRVTCTSDKADGSTAGRRTFAAVGGLYVCARRLNALSAQAWAPGAARVELRPGRARRPCDTLRLLGRLRHRPPTRRA